MQTKRQINNKIKRLVGKPTLLEAKIKLGRWLTLVYSAAYDSNDDYGLRLEERWDIVLDKRGYTVSYQGEPWTAMTFNRAYNLVVNPAILMLRSGLLEPWQLNLDNTHRTTLDKRVFLLQWINPREVRTLERHALEDHRQESKRRHQRYAEGKTRLKERVYNKSGMKMLISTGHATFDRQTNSLGTGNFWANTMHGGYIRAFTEVGCNGLIRKPGHLQEFDLEYYRDIGTPAFILDAVRQAARDRSVQFYVLFSWYMFRNRNTRVIHGYILADKNDRLIKKWNIGPTWKSWYVIDGALPYLAWVEKKEQDNA